MIVRELVTRLGVDLDAKKVNEAESKLSKLKGIMQTLAGMFAFNQVAGFLSNTVSMASGVEQTLQKLQMGFQGSTDGVLGWAKTLSESTGASEYELREMAATFGSMLVPTLKFDRPKAAEMSKTLSGLAYDLAAINNLDPQETLGRLFSGMTGETEGVERLGIGIKQTALAEFALTQGIKKKVTAMTVAEKTELIYGKILSDTRDKVGAAARESNTYAGRQLKLRAATRDLHTKIGEFLIGPAAKLVGWLTEAARGMKEWASHAANMKAAAIVLSAVMGSLAIYMAAVNWPILAAAAALGVLYLIVQDLVVMFQGGESAFGKFLDEVDGAGTAKIAVQDLKDAWAEMMKVMMDPAFRKWIKDTLKDMVDTVRIMAKIVGWLHAVGGDTDQFERESDALKDQLFAGTITSDEYGKRIGELKKRRNVRRDEYEAGLSAKGAPLPRLPTVGTSSGISRTGGVHNDIVINLTPNVSADELQQTKRAIIEAQQSAWRGAYQTTHISEKRAPSPDYLSPVPL